MEGAHVIRATTPSVMDAPPDGKCEGCESRYVIHLYTKIAKRRAENANLIVVRAPSDREEHKVNDEQSGSESGEES